MIEEKTLAELHSVVKIEEIIGSFVTIQKKGSKLWACCPFHNENTPSFTISPEKGIYKCFGCGVSGDAISFLQELEGYSFADAVKYLANRYNINVEETISKKNKETESFEGTFLLLNTAKDFYIKNLLHTKEGTSVGLKYLHSRKISDDAIKKFELGYSLDQWDALYKEIQVTEYSKDSLAQTGLFIEKGDNIYDRFRGRVIFPIHNISGKVTSFGARIVEKNSDQPKYINSPETSVFHKRSSLYGIFQAKSEIKKNDCCYLVEGYTDVIAVYDCGIKNVIASMGTSLTLEQINIIQRYTKNITIIFDGDTAGIKASLRNIDIMLTHGMYVKVVPLPETEDPHSLATRLESSAFKDFLKKNEEDFLEFKANFLLNTAGEDTLLKAEAIQDIIQSLATVHDVVKRLLLTKKCSKILEIDEKILLEEQDKIIISRSKNSKIENFRSTKTPQRKYTPEERTSMLIESHEKELIRILLNYGNMSFNKEISICQYLISELEEISFSNFEYAYIWTEFKKNLDNGVNLEANYFIHDENEQVRKKTIELLSPQQDISTNWSDKHQIQVSHENHDLNDTVYKNILRLKLSIIRKLITTNLNLLETSKDPENQNELLHRHTTLKQVEKAIAEQLGTVVW